MRDLQQVFSHDRYLFRRKVFRFLGGEFSIYDGDQSLVMYSEQKRFKLKEDIRIYSEKTMMNEVLTVKAKQIFDFRATYKVVDPTTGEAVGALRRKGFKSIVKDEWLLLDPQEQEVGAIKEDNLGLALVRRFGSLATYLFPQRYTITTHGQEVGSLKQHFNPFVLKYTLDLSENYERQLDPRLAIAGGILFCAIEQRQN
jgi:uncharacterized protein YxjI